MNATARTYTSLRAAWIPLAALCLAFFVEMVDNTLLSIALPTIGRELGGDTTSLQWVSGAYSLTFGGLLLTAGSIADRFGRRRVLQIGLALFGLMSVAVVFVTSTGELIALRAALGIAAAAMAPITNSLVFRLFDDEKLRMRAPQSGNIDHHACLILPVGQRLAIETRVVEVIRERHRIAFEKISDGVHADRGKALCHLRTDGRRGFEVVAFEQIGAVRFRSFLRRARRNRIRMQRSRDGR